MAQATYQDDPTPAPNSWLPPGYTLNPDGSVTDPSGKVVSGAPPDGYFRDPRDGTIKWKGPGYPQTDNANPQGGAAVAPPPVTPPPTTDKKTPPPAATKGTVGGLLSPFGETAPDIPAGPYFTPPVYAPPPAYTPLTGESVLNEPGYAFRLGQGEQALQQSAAARGVLNTGGTLKDILGYGQNFASGEYNAADQRDRANYLTNYKTQYTDPYDYAYKSSLDTFAAKQHASDLGYQNAYEAYLQRFRQFQDQRDSTFDKTFKTVTA